MPIFLDAELKIGALLRGGSKDQKSANYTREEGLRITFQKSWDNLGTCYMYQARSLAIVVSAPK